MANGWCKATGIHCLTLLEPRRLKPMCSEQENVCFRFGPCEIYRANKRRPQMRSPVGLELTSPCLVAGGIRSGLGNWHRRVPGPKVYPRSDCHDSWGTHSRWRLEKAVCSRTCGSGTIEATYTRFYSNGQSSWGYFDPMTPCLKATLECDQVFEERNSFSRSVLRLASYFDDCCVLFSLKMF